MTRTIIIDGREYPVTLCPPGEALHSHYLRRCGYGIELPVDLTVRPRASAAFFTTGQWKTFNIKSKRGQVKLWPQEAFVFFNELTSYRTALILLDAMEKDEQRLIALKKRQEQAKKTESRMQDILRWLRTP